MDRMKNQGDNAMKLLKVEVEGLPLFKEKMSLDFYAAQRISKTHKMNLHRISSNMYVNPTTAIAGINAWKNFCFENINVCLRNAE